MPAKQRCVPAIRTVRLRITPEANAGKVAALATTVAEWDRAVAFYTDLFLDHPGVFDQRKTVADPETGEMHEKPWNDKDWLTWVERVTVATWRPRPILNRYPQEGLASGAAACWSRVRAQAACRERRGTTPNGPPTPLVRMGTAPSPQSGKDPGATGASRIGAAQRTAVGVCQANQAEVYTTMPRRKERWCNVGMAEPAVGSG